LSDATYTVYIEIIITATAVTPLLSQVTSTNLGEKYERPLLTSLSAAADSFARGNFTVSLNQLMAFQNKVRAQIAPWNPTLAAELIEAVQEIIDALISKNSSNWKYGRADSNAFAHPKDMSRRMTLRLHWCFFSNLDNLRFY